MVHPKIGEVGGVREARRVAPVLTHALRFCARKGAQLPEEPLQIEQLGALVAGRREKDGLNLREAAELAGVSFNTLSRVERGHTPDLNSFRKIVDWLGVPADRFGRA